MERRGGASHETRGAEEAPPPLKETGVGVKLAAVITAGLLLLYILLCFEDFHFHVTHVYAHLGYPNAQHILGQRYLQAGGEVIDLTGDEVIDITGNEVIDLTGEDVIDLTGEDVIDLTGESSEPEVIIISDDESAVDREQNQQHSHVSSETENSADLLARDDEEEPRDVDSPWPAGPATPPSSEDEDSEQEWGPPHFFRSAENSTELPARDAEEEPRDNQGAQPAGPASPPTSDDEDSEQPFTLYWVFMDITFEVSLLKEKEGKKQLQAKLMDEQERRNVTPSSQEQVDGSGNGSGANDAPVADSDSAEEGSEEEDTQSSELCDVDDSLCQPCVAMSSAAGASLLPWRMLICAQPAEWSSAQNCTIQFIYECFGFSGEI
ncbi:hypothetical protein HGM15179_012019 [Zosterops borbonicus]|uniref:Uncharacterized protein n=1 Tax=Zosterops borbonicus TaxID=364589 RepID=A0A8K1GAL8_9PASS|nr:hypothetical protein HGM15179_012019 [Zosterops borbonicus]